MNTIQRVIVIEKREPVLKEGKGKEGKKYAFYQGLFFIEGLWRQCAMARNNEVQITLYNKIKPGDSVDVILFNEERYGNIYRKFRFPNEVEILAKRVEQLENVVRKLWQDRSNPQKEEDHEKKSQGQ